jgi:nitroreductase
MDQFKEAMKFRHACKIFDENKKISDEDIYQILEVGRESASSFGMEPWKFLVITNQKLKQKLQPYCWNQPQITSCSHLIVILAAIESVKIESGIPAKKFARRGISKEQQEKYLNVYANHLKTILQDDNMIYTWTSKQTYIAMSNMITYAATKKIDSCPIEGFEKDEVQKVLNLDSSKYQVSVLVPMGYRINPQSPQLRDDFEDIVNLTFAPKTK